MLECPCCGQSVEDLDIWPIVMKDGGLLVDGKYVRLTSHQRRIVERLLESRGIAVSREQIVEAMYGHDPNGGALTASKMVDVMVFQIRKRIGDRDLIENIWGYGYRIPLRRPR